MKESRQFSAKMKKCLNKEVYKVSKMPKVTKMLRVSGLPREIRRLPCLPRKEERLYLGEI